MGKLDVDKVLLNNSAKVLEQLSLLALNIFGGIFPKPKETTHRNLKSFSKENIIKNIGQILGKDVLKIMHLLKTFSYIL